MGEEEWGQERYATWRATSVERAGGGRDARREEAARRGHRAPRTRPSRRWRRPPRGAAAPAPAVRGAGADGATGRDARRVGARLAPQGGRGAWRRARAAAPRAAVREGSGGGLMVRAAPTARLGASRWRRHDSRARPPEAVAPPRQREDPDRTHEEAQQALAALGGVEQLAVVIGSRPSRPRAGRAGTGAGGARAARAAASAARVDRRRRVGRLRRRLRRARRGGDRGLRGDRLTSASRQQRAAQPARQRQHGSPGDRDREAVAERLRGGVAAGARRTARRRSRCRRRRRARASCCWLLAAASRSPAAGPS